VNVNVGLNIEVMVFPGSSMESTLQYMYDTRDLVQDPGHESYLKTIKRIEMGKSVLKNILSYIPMVGQITGLIFQVVQAILDFPKRLTIPFLYIQIQQQTKNEGADTDPVTFRPHLQGRHQKVNSIIAMIRRFRTGKPYIVKRVSKGYFEPIVDLEGGEGGEGPGLEGVGLESAVVGRAELVLVDEATVLPSQVTMPPAQLSSQV
jgi:hypothetical protein